LYNIILLCILVLRLPQMTRGIPEQSHHFKIEHSNALMMSRGDYYFCKHTFGMCSCKVKLRKEQKHCCTHAMHKVRWKAGQQRVYSMVADFFLRHHITYPPSPTTTATRTIHPKIFPPFPPFDLGNISAIVSHPATFCP